MKRIAIFILLLTAGLGCHSPQLAGDHNASRHYSQWEEAAKRICTADTESAQVAAIWTFIRLWDKHQDQYPSLRSYEMWFFDKDGQLLFPEVDFRNAACYALVGDFKNHPAVFSPFMLELRGPRSAHTLLRPR